MDLRVIVLLGCFTFLKKNRFLVRDYFRQIPMMLFRMGSIILLENAGARYIDRAIRAGTNA